MPTRVCFSDVPAVQMKIKDLQVGQSGRITGYATRDRAYRQKLLQMGLTRGTPFRLVRKAPLGDPVEIETRGFHLTLRKAEAEAVDIDPEH